MMPSLFTPGSPRDWNVPRAGAYGACIGLAAALIKMFSPGAASPHIYEVAAAAVGFAVLCAAAAALRNAVARRLIWPD
jgi:hypothetical protein